MANNNSITSASNPSHEQYNQTEDDKVRTLVAGLNTEGINALISIADKMLEHIKNGLSLDEVESDLKSKFDDFGQSLDLYRRHA